MNTVVHPVATRDEEHMDTILGKLNFFPMPQIKTATTQTLLLASGVRQIQRQAEDDP